MGNRAQTALRSPGLWQRRERPWPGPQRSVLWLATAPSALAQALSAGLTGGLHIAALHEGAPGLPEARCAPVWVLELAATPETPPALNPAQWGQRCQNHGQPMTLVLLPPDQLPQAWAWLDAGADRCLAADSAPELVLAMVRSMLRRQQGLTAVFSEHGPLRFDHDTQTLFHQAERVPLTCRETQVASLLFQGGARLVRPREILNVLGVRDGLRENTALVALYVHRINRKIRPHGLHIDFVRGYGYRLGALAPASRPAEAASWLSPLACGPGNGADASKAAGLR